MAANRAQEEGAVFNRAAQGSHLIQGRRVGDQPVTRNPAIGRLDSAYAAIGCGKADGAARV